MEFTLAAAKGTARRPWAHATSCTIRAAASSRHAMTLCPRYTRSSLPRSPRPHHPVSDCPGTSGVGHTARVPSAGLFCQLPCGALGKRRPGSCRPRPGSLGPQGLAGSRDCPSVGSRGPGGSRRCRAAAVRCVSRAVRRTETRRGGLSGGEGAVSEDPRGGECGRRHHFRLGGRGGGNEGVQGSRAEPPLTSLTWAGVPSVSCTGPVRRRPVCRLLPFIFKRRDCARAASVRVGFSFTAWRGHHPQATRPPVYSEPL